MSVYNYERQVIRPREYDLDDDYPSQRQMVRSRDRSMSSRSRSTHSSRRSTSPPSYDDSIPSQQSEKQEKRKRRRDALFKTFVAIGVLQLVAGGLQVYTAVEQERHARQDERARTHQEERERYEAYERKRDQSRPSTSHPSYRHEQYYDWKC